MDEEFSSLLKEVAKQSFDAIIPIKRKGSAVIKRLKSIKTIPELANIQVLDSEYFTEDDIKGRRVVIFDDAIFSGQTIENFLNRVRSFGPKHVSVVTLVLYSKSGVRAFCKYKVGRKGFRQWMKKRVRYYLQLGFPLDPDHLVINCELEITDQNKLVNLFKDSGKQIGSPHDVSDMNGSKMISIDVDPSKLLGSVELSLPSFIEGFEACKVRLYFDFDNNFVNIVPIANPIVLTSRKEDRCKEDVPNCFLKLFPTKAHPNADRKVCRDCLTFNCSWHLAKLYLEKLRARAQNQRIGISFSSISWDEMETTYRTVSRLLQIPVVS